MCTFKPILSPVRIFLELFIFLSSLAYTTLAASADLASIQNIRSEVLANSILKPAMGVYYDNFRLNYSFIYTLKLNIEKFDKNYEYLDRQNRLEFSPYLNVINKNISEMDAFIVNISNSLNISPVVVRQGFGLTFSAEQRLYDEGTVATGRLLADRYWRRHPGNTEDVNDFYNEKPPPVLLANFYPNYISMLRNNYQTNIINQAILFNNQLVQATAANNQRQADIKAEREKRDAEEVRRLEQLRLANIRAESERKIAEAEQSRREIAESKKYQAEQNFQNAQFKVVDKLGPLACSSIIGISKYIKEDVGGKLAVDPAVIRFNRSEYVLAEDTVYMGFFNRSPALSGSPTCKLILYTPRGPVNCITDYRNVSTLIGNKCNGYIQ